jgi:5-oxoprolinase (ATP-hydrolysing) subunit A
MSARIDFNCDLGEGMPQEAAILPQISSASLACGFHAGEPEALRISLRACRKQGVAVGAHPSLPDREGFGRRELACTPAQVYAQTLYQLGALAALARAEGVVLRHVKPHGALYNLAARDAGIASAVAEAVRDFDPGLRLFGLSGSELPRAGERLGLAVVHEVFAERRYEASGQLTPRSHPDAVIKSLDESIEQVRELVRNGRVRTRTGESVTLRADSLCLHGDRPDAADFARALRRALEDEGIRVQALDSA